MYALGKVHMRPIPSPFLSIRGIIRLETRCIQAVTREFKKKIMDFTFKTFTDFLSNTKHCHFFLGALSHSTGIEYIEKTHGKTH